MKSFINGTPRDPARIDPMLDKIREAWKLYPDMRLGQLIAVCTETDHIVGIEDDKLLCGVCEYIKNMRGCDVYDLHNR